MAYITPKDCKTGRQVIATTDLIAMLERHDFEVGNQSGGSHYKYRHNQYPWILGTLVYGSTKLDSQKHAAKACEAVLAEQEKRANASPSFKAAAIDNAKPIKDQLPPTVDVVEDTEEEILIRSKKMPAIGTAIKLSSSPEDVQAQITKLQTHAKEFEIMLGRARTEFDFITGLFEKTTCYGVNEVYNSVQFTISPYTSETRDLDPFEQLASAITDVMTRDEIDKEYQEYLSSLPFARESSQYQTERKGNKKVTTVFHNIVSGGKALLNSETTPNIRRPLGAIVYNLGLIFDKLAPSMTGEAILRFCAIKLKREDDHLKGHYLPDPSITLDIRILPKDLGPELKDYKNFNALSLPDVERHLRSAKEIFDMMAENYLQITQTLNKVREQDTALARRVIEMEMKAKSQGFSRSEEPKDPKPGKPVQYVLTRGQDVVKIQGWIIDRLQKDGVSTVRALVFQPESVAKAEKELESLLAKNDPLATPFVRAGKISRKDLLGSSSGSAMPSNPLNDPLDEFFKGKKPKP